MVREQMVFGFRTHLHHTTTKMPQKHITHAKNIKFSMMLRNKRLGIEALVQPQTSQN